MRYVVGVDLGTQSCKAVVCDEQLAVVGSHAVPVATSFPQPGWAEQDPRAWETALEAAVAGALHGTGVVSAAAAVAGAGPIDAREVAAIAIAGQLDGCVAVDAHGEPLHAALIWQDRRATAETFDVPLDVTGQVADASHMAPKIAWLRARLARAPQLALSLDAPGAHAHAPVRFHQPVSYLVARLTGAHVLDPSHASTTMLYDLAAGTWSAPLLARYGIAQHELPAIAPATAVAGTLRRELAGIPAGTPVAVGTGDDFATPLGAGVVSPGPLLVTLGTAEVVGTLAASAVLDRTPPSPMVETHAYPTGAFFVENPGWLSGGAVRWATRMLGLGSDSELDALAAEAPPGAGGITFVPALAGAMTPVWDARRRGALLGLSAAHDRPHVARAVLEGLAFACRDISERLAQLGLPHHEALVLGGGTHSDVWLQIRADALGIPHRVAARSDTCAIGAAMVASVAAGIHRDLPAAAATAPAPRATIEPRGSLDEAYALYQMRNRSTS
ncbi:MAG TPA: FGGY family carbohydrate kinase [Kofleriaceae bacterium]|nr:FGGY family carbohydrate kinase [Kofleriaceae bacterium]